MLRSILACGLAIVMLAIPSSRACGQSVTDRSYVQGLLGRLRDSSEAVRDSAVREVRSRGRSIVPALQTFLRSSTVELQSAAAYALVRIGAPALPAIRDALDDTSMASFDVSEALGWSSLTDSDALTLLDPLLHDPSARVRSAATSALGSRGAIGAPVGTRLLERLDDPDPSVRTAAADEFFYVHDSASRAAGALALTRLLADSRQDVRRAAVYTLGNMGDVAAPGIPGIIERMRFDPDTEVRWLSARVLGWLGPQASSAVPALLAHLDDTLPTVRLEALGSLGGIGISRVPVARGDSVIAALRSRLVSDDSLTRETAVRALGAIGARAIPALAGALHSPDSTVATIAAMALGYLSDESSVIAPLGGSLGDRRRSVRDAAADALGGIGKQVLPLLRSRASSSDPLVREAAGRALNVYAASASLPILRSCYEASYGPWTPPMESETIEGVVPPDAMRFSSVRRPFRRDSTAYAFVLERRYRDKWYPAGYWIPDSTSREVRLDPSPSLSGVAMTLTVTSADDIRGTVRTYWDFPAKTQTASVVLTRIDCSAAHDER